MKKGATIVVGMLILSASVCRSQGVQDTSARDELYKTIDQIRLLMQGAPFDQVKQYVSAEAMVIEGDSTRRLVDVLKRKDRQSILHEDSTRQGVQIMARSNKREDAIYVVLKTVNAKKEDPHYHSFVLYKEPEAGWQIYLWHVGS